MAEFIVVLIFKAYQMCVKKELTVLYLIETAKVNLKGGIEI